MKPITCSKEDDARKRERWREIAVYTEKYGRKRAGEYFGLGRERIRQILVLDKRFNKNGELAER